MGLEVVAVLEGHAVDALQHRARAVAQPIGPGDMGQLEPVGGHLAGVLEMRATAEVLPVPVPIHPQVLVGGDLVDQFHLIGFAAFFVVGQRVGPAPDFGAHGIARVDDLLHLGFDLAKVFGGKGLGAVKVIEPAIVAHRADGDFDVRPNLLHRGGP